MKELRYFRKHPKISTTCTISIPKEEYLIWQNQEISCWKRKDSWLSYLQKVKSNMQKIMVLHCHACNCHFCKGAIDHLQCSIRHAHKTTKPIKKSHFCSLSMLLTAQKSSWRYKDMRISKRTEESPLKICHMARYQGCTV